MNNSPPRYLLFSEARRGDKWLDNRNDAPLDRSDRHRTGGQWRFVLESLDTPTVMDVEENEEEQEPERLELLAVVRGLEALEQPSRVTLITASQYVCRGLRRGLNAWRENGWQWERFGQWVPVKNGDLWQRIDRALQFHQVDCRTWRSDSRASSESLVAPNATAPKTLAEESPPYFRPVSIGVITRWMTRWTRRICGYMTQSLDNLRPHKNREAHAA